MIPQVGTTCSFSFISKFSTLDGIYRIREETTFLNAVSTGIDFVERLYSPAGLAQSDFDSDFASYKTDRVMILESVYNTDVIFCVPESALQKIPDPTIREYFPLMLVVSLGVFSNNQEVIPVIDSVTDLIQSTLGVTSPVEIVSNQNNKKYMSDADYGIIKAARDANKVALSPLSVQLRQAQDQITFLAAKVAEYEALIAQIAT